MHFEIFKKEVSPTNSFQVKPLLCCCTEGLRTLTVKNAFQPKLPLASVQGGRGVHLPLRANPHPTSIRVKLLLNLKGRSFSENYTQRGGDLALFLVHTLYSITQTQIQSPAKFCL